MGPVRGLWTIRFEAFHQFFIRMAQKLRNYINITKTLSERFQKRRAVQTMNGPLPIIIEIIGKQCSVPLKRENKWVVNAMEWKFNCNRDQEICQVNHVRFKGLDLRVGGIVILDVNAAGVPTFLSITHLFVLHDTVGVLGQLTYVTKWNAHLHAYVVNVSQGPEDLACVEASQIISPQTLDCYEIGTQKVVKLQYAVAEPEHDE